MQKAKDREQKAYGAIGKGRQDRIGCKTVGIQANNDGHRQLCAGKQTGVKAKAIQHHIKAYSVTCWD